MSSYEAKTRKGLALAFALLAGAFVLHVVTGRQIAKLEERLDAISPVGSKW